MQKITNLNWGRRLQVIIILSIFLIAGAVNMSLTANNTAQKPANLVQGQEIAMVIEPFPGGVVTNGFAWSG